MIRHNSPYAICHACGFRFEVTTKLLEDLAQTIDCIHNEIGQYLIQVNQDSMHAPHDLQQVRTRSSATAEKQRVSCPHGGG